MLMSGIIHTGVVRDPLASSGTFLKRRVCWLLNSVGGPICRPVGNVMEKVLFQQTCRGKWQYKNREENQPIPQCKHYSKEGLQISI